MIYPKHLRDQSRAYRERAKWERDPIISKRLASHALALAQLAEKIERDSKEGVAHANNLVGVVGNAIQILLLAPVATVVDLSAVIPAF